MIGWIRRLASSCWGPAVGPRRWAASLAGLLAAGGAAALAGVACCGPIFVVWLAQAVFLAGGVTALVLLVRYEAIILLAIALVAWFGWRFAPDRWSRRAQGVLGCVALGGSLTRLLWDLNADLVVLLVPLYWLFILRQTIMAALAFIVLGMQIVGLVRVGLRPICIPDRPHQAATTNGGSAPKPSAPIRERPEPKRPPHIKQHAGEREGAVADQPRRVRG